MKTGPKLNTSRCFGNRFAVRGYTEVAELMNLTPNGVRHIEKKALEKLRKRLITAMITA